MTETEKTVNEVLARYESGLLEMPKKDYTFTTLSTEIKLTIQEKLILAGLLAVGTGLLGLMITGAVTVVRWFHGL